MGNGSKAECIFRYSLQNKWQLWNLLEKPWEIISPSFSQEPPFHHMLLKWWVHCVPQVWSAKPGVLCCLSQLCSFCGHDGWYPDRPRIYIHQQFWAHIHESFIRGYNRSSKSQANKEVVTSVISWTDLKCEGPFGTGCGPGNLGCAPSQPGRQRDLRWGVSSWNLICI